jgi:hypothetical protein
MDGKFRGVGKSFSMKRKIVKFYILKSRMSTHKNILELYMNEDLDIIEGGATTSEGEMLLKALEKNPITVEDKQFSFLDKEIYLRNLYLYFNSPYLSASKYSNQDSEIPD